VDLTDRKKVEENYQHFKDRLKQRLDDLPTLWMMREDLVEWGKKPGAAALEEYNKWVVPTIAKLDDLRHDLDGLYDKLKTAKLDDPKSLEPALKLTIKARQDLGDLPRALADLHKDDSNEFASSTDWIYHSGGLRRHIEAAITVRLNRFEVTMNRYIAEAHEAKGDPTKVKNLAESQREFSSYAELTQQFTELFRNLYKYDTLQLKDEVKVDDPFATLAAKLDQGVAEAAAKRAEKVEAAHQKALTDAAAKVIPVANALGAVAVAVSPLDSTIADMDLQWAETKKAEADRAVRETREAVQKVGAAADLQKKQPVGEPRQLYMQLLAEIYLDLFNLENELNRSPLIQAPFQRIERDTQPIVLLPEQGDGQGNQGEKNQTLTVQLLKETPQISRVAPLELAPFTAEEKAAFDLIVGFTRPMSFLKNSDDWPTLRLFSSAGAAADEVGAPFLQIDPAKTTDHMLVYRLPYPNRDAGRISKGTYYPRLQLQQKHLPERGGQVDFTFSVASENPKVLLTASLRQVAIRADTDEENDDEVANRGIIARSKSAAIIEALVTAGSPVRYVTVTGNYQKIETSGGTVRSPALTFLDDGVWPDTTKEDGVYTAKITLDPQEQRKQAIYQVMIEARWNDKTAFVPFEQLKVPDKPASSSPTTRSRRAMAPKPPQDPPRQVDVPKFQRATSVDFLVEGAEGTS
jgi:hypothetical protein